ncbi:AraC family transcriptional regulator (plasmid) [Photobacterium sp. DA100]|uniref:AraC family transcriptional regulator n=1 Tax=Photobacterium sp. DA100 TaxID=3027472 RepID=UPI0024794E9E|nr:AraC family transcriptional regulator [Photobacterium sp. DA100]WEM44589.1 AraC family transcriptional regulator [Photobacterium sp. DA100]
MTRTARHIRQSYWTSKHTPYLTIRSTRDSTQSYKSHYHSELSIGIMESGVTCLSLPEKHIALNKGDIVLIEPNMVHSCNPVNGKPRSYHMLYIDNDWCCEVLSMLFGHEVTMFTIDQSSLQDTLSTTGLGEIISALLVEESSELISKVEYALFDILSLCCSPRNELVEGDKLAVRVKNLLLRDIACSPPLETLALELGHTKETVIRQFKSHFGITPKSFLNNHRVEKAKILLRGGMPIVDVAIEVGFSDQSQLHRAFVNYTASTPRQYQKIKSIFDNIS